MTDGAHASAWAAAAEQCASSGHPGVQQAQATRQRSSEVHAAAHAAHAWGWGRLALGGLSDDTLRSCEQAGNAGGIQQRGAHNLQRGEVR